MSADGVADEARSGETAGRAASSAEAAGAPECAAWEPEAGGVEAGDGAEGPRQGAGEGTVQGAGATEYAWPLFQYSVRPTRRFRIWRPFRASADAAALPLPCGNFPKSIQWSPDGSCFAISSEDCNIRVFDLPPHAMALQQLPEPADQAQPGSPLGHHAQEQCLRGDEAEGVGKGQLRTEEAEDLEPATVIREGETVYSSCWYPLMAATDAQTCVLASSSKDHPIHLWDILTGQLRATYRAYDHLDEISAAYSLAFSAAGDKLFAGYERTIRVFDVSTPGRDFAQHSTVTPKPERHGQNGMISSLATSLFQPGLLAAGSYDRTAGIYAADGRELVAVLHGHQGGVTQVMFSRDGNFLYTGARKDPQILCWDLRNCSTAVYGLQRQTHSTNQRVAFDIEPQGQHLATGGEDGNILVYDLASGTLVSSFPAAPDIVTGASFHPLCLPLLATCSGQRKFVVPDLEGGAEQNSTESSGAEGDTDDESSESTDQWDDGENAASLWTLSFKWSL